MTDKCDGEAPRASSMGRYGMPSPTRCTAGELTRNDTPAKRATRG